MDKVALIKIPAKQGCEGCYFDQHEGCSIDKHIESYGLPMPLPEEWDCNDKENCYIYVPKEE